jgi:AcrR family transcriptional regulator
MMGEMPRKANVRPDDPGRERMLEAALALFGERGYHATSIVEIGERADISKSVLYHYFDSKAKLYEAVIEAETRELLRRVAHAIPVDAHAPRLRAGVDAYLAFLAERPLAWRLLLRDPPSEPALLATHEKLARERAKSLSRLLAAPPKRAAAAAHVQLVGVGIRAFASWWYENRSVPREAITEAILDFAASGARHIVDVEQGTAEETSLDRRPRTERRSPEGEVSDAGARRASSSEVDLPVGQGQ